MIKILAIGNSFSQDASAYIHSIALSGGADVKVANMYIGGCSLEQHYNNMLSGAPDYAYELNGAPAEKYISIGDALNEDKWDYITLQQASHYSGIRESYYPYLTELSAYIKKLCPDAVQLIHETWAYEKDSSHSAFPDYNCDQNKMYSMLKSCYYEASEKIDTAVIPVGDVIQALREIPEFDYSNGGLSLNRDGFHLSIPYGRYAAGAVWYEYILKGNILETDYIPDHNGIPADTGLIKIIRHKVHDMITGY